VLFLILISAKKNVIFVQISENKTCMKNQYTNREISWLQFNDRVLQEAEDTNNPLHERMKFLGIFSNNQDEFFRVRVATLHRLVSLNEKRYPKRAASFQQILDDIYSITRQQGTKFSRIYTEIKQELATHNVHIIDETSLSETQGIFVKQYFQEEVRPELFPIMLKQLKDTDHLKDRSIYLAAILHREETKPHFSLIKIPSDILGRFLILPSENENQYIMILDDVIRYCLDDIFSLFHYTHYETYTFKFTRDAELDMNEDVSKSFMEIMSDSLKKRKTGNPVRFVYDRNMPEYLLEKLIGKISANKSDHLIQGDRYHNFKDFMKFPNLIGKKHAYKNIKPIWHQAFIPGESMFSCIKEKDIMLHFPYQSFQHIIDLLREASIDPKVRSIKITLYRVASHSSVINALINAARNGKNVTVFFELQARFDEKQNIALSEKLQTVGVKVIASIPGFKVHSKLLIIRRKEEQKNIYYTYIGTGNFNEDTAELYADDGLLTAHPIIAHEVRKVFELFEASFKQFRFRNLIVSPFSTRNFFLKMIEKEIENQEKGKTAWITLKLNNLADLQLVNKLQKASQAGVKIRLIIRGICILVPGIPGVSENIEVISILDKFLEHSRILAFANNGDPKVYIGSADWMGRNLDTRIEVTCPILDTSIRDELLNMLEIQLQDNMKARILDGSFRNKFKTNDEVPVRTQWATYDFLKTIHNS
jgi:polyphosphate kinase